MTPFPTNTKNSYDDPNHGTWSEKRETFGNEKNG
jgi:hypothetical protein